MASCLRVTEGRTETSVATGRESEEESRGLKQHLKMTPVTLGMNSGHSSAILRGVALSGLICFQGSRALPFHLTVPQRSWESASAACPSGKEAPLSTVCLTSCSSVP